ncbi:YccT family protein [Vibrio sinaloensis]|uniref:YccT family protein n=1 Tax=Photobacterium sp. (strain ATCC 43367) TaxID=379097 RepID=UPI002060FF72|nr:DUF2057 family protein [Vibrio sinaloensis]UPQ88627.1 DUF2057 domain-containing protein [Vibrio sinaloensis]
MKMIKTVGIVGAVITSFAPMAKVDLTFHRDISPLIIQGEEVGFSLFNKSAYQLEDGQSQIVLRVSKLVDKQGEKEKFNSEVLVVSFDASNEQVLIEPGMTITRKEHATAFDANPSLKITSSTGQKLDYQQAILPASMGVTRDYEKELAKFNKANGIVVPGMVAATAVESQSAIQSAQPSSAQSMVQYWYEKAQPVDKEQFVEWAFANRKQQQLEALDSDSKPLEMMSYWYTEADAGERKAIFAWLVSQ